MQSQNVVQTSMCLHHYIAWWRHQMETFSAILTICTGNSLVIGEFPAQRPVTRSFDVFFDLRPNKRLSKQSWGWWFETPSCPLCRHCNGTQSQAWKLMALLLGIKYISKWILAWISNCILIKLWNAVIKHGGSCRRPYSRSAMRKATKAQRIGNMMVWQLSVTFLLFGDQGVGARNGPKTCVLSEWLTTLCAFRTALTEWDSPVLCKHRVWRHWKMLKLFKANFIIHLKKNLLDNISEG